MMRRSVLVFLPPIIAVLLLFTVEARPWVPLPLVEDRLVYMPGTQLWGEGNSQNPGTCSNCHIVQIEPRWRGSLMAHSARDPLWVASLTVAYQDSIWAVGNPNGGSLCVRCHAPVCWLQGKADPPDASFLKGTGKEGVQCNFCHRLLDPMAVFMQPDVPPDDGLALEMALKTTARDLEVLEGLSLFDDGAGSPDPFLDPATGLPFWYSPWLPGAPPGYEANVSGQFFLDPKSTKRGPFSDPQSGHPKLYSRYHKSSRLCALCHEASNPVLARVEMGEDVPERRTASSYYQMERTMSEFLLSDYGRPGGAATSLGFVPWAEACQDCHMRKSGGTATSKNKTPVRTDLPHHDMTGGNQWILRVLASADRDFHGYDDYNYRIISGDRYEGTAFDVEGLQSQGEWLWRGAVRAALKMKIAVTIEEYAPEDEGHIYLRLRNNTGHKVPSGFPSGKRMFLNVRFFDGADTLIEEVNPYAALVTERDTYGSEVFVEGGDITERTEELIWEAVLSSSLTAEEKTQHFLLATDRHRDNRIPPKGFRNGAEMFDRLVQPRWHGPLPEGGSCSGDCPAYFTAAEYGGGHDDIVINKPAGTSSWAATLYYQAPTRDYVAFLRDEIDGTATTLTAPTYAQTNGLNPDPDPPYLAQDDPFFAKLRDTGAAVWDLWLHNGGAAPVPMAWAGEEPPPCPTEPPGALTAAAGKRMVSLTWDPDGDAYWYSVYAVEDDTYFRLGSTTDTSYVESGLPAGKVRCYVVTAYRTCGSESDFSMSACAVPLRK